MATRRAAIASGASGATLSRAWRGALLALAFLLPGAAPAQNARPIRMVVPYPAGTGTDIVARTLAQKWADRYGRSVVVDNRPGGGTIIGMDIVAKAAPDGQTLLVATTSLAIAPGLHAHLPFDPVKDFRAIILTDSAPLLLVAPASLQVNTLQDFLALARAKPGQLSYGSSGNGGAIHLAMELLKSMTGINLVHVPYKGSPAALLDVLAGRVAVMFNIISSSVPHMTSGKLRPLGVSGASRSLALPDVPTIAEAGVTGYEAVSWHGLLAPAGTPAALIDRLHREIRALLLEADVRGALVAQGFEPSDKGPDEFSKFIRKEVSKWTRVVKASGAHID